MIVRTTAAALVSGLLVTGAVGLAWSAPASSQSSTVAQVASANAVLQPASGVLAAPELPRIQRLGPEAQNCKPAQMYSAHDIVGDPQACIIGNTGIGGMPTAIAVPAL